MRFSRIILDTIARDHATGRTRAGARALAAVYAMASAVIPIAYFTSSDRHAHAPAVLALFAFVAGAFCLLYRWPARMPVWALDVAVFVTGGLVTIGVAADPSHASAIPELYVWVTLFAFYFLSPWRGFAQLVAIASAYGTVLVTQPTVDAFSHWTMLVLTLVGLGPLVAIVQIRVRGLVSDLESAALLDPLTGLANRRGFAEAFDRARDRPAVPIALIKGDIDLFTVLNDELGTRAGDQALLHIAEILGARAMDDRCIARMGGEEFAILVTGMDLGAAHALAEGVRIEIERAFEQEAVQLTMSLGISWTAGGASDPTGDLLMAEADQALRAAKANGRNQAVPFSDDVVALMPKLEARREAQRALHLGTMLTLARVLDMRDQSTSGHSHTVSVLAQAMAQELALPARIVERIRLAGVLHDIGKIGIPDAILLKPSSLSDEEWATMQTHPQIGAQILDSLELRDIREWVMCHHERPDGAGYPRQLRGEEIPIAARILAVADAFEAMISDRYYRRGQPVERAIAELERCSGSQFDARVVSALLRRLPELPLPQLDHAHDGTGILGSPVIDRIAGYDDDHGLREAA